MTPACSVYLAFSEIKYAQQAVCLLLEGLLPALTDKTSEVSRVAFEDRRGVLVRFACGTSLRID